LGGAQVEKVSLFSSLFARGKAQSPFFKSMNEQVVILDFGSQYTQVIARRIRECSVYSTILRYDTPAAEIAALKPRESFCPAGLRVFMQMMRPCPISRFLS
jgi:hypothetical protein